MHGESQHSAIQQPCHRLPEVTPRSPDDCAHDGTRIVATAAIGVIGLPGQAKRERKTLGLSPDCWTCNGVYRCEVWELFYGRRHGKIFSAEVAGRAEIHWEVGYLGLIRRIIGLIVSFLHWIAISDYTFGLFNGGSMHNNSTYRWLTMSIPLFPYASSNY